MKESFYSILSALFILTIIFSLYILVLYKPTVFHETPLLSDIAMLIKVGSLFIGSAVMLIVIGYYKQIAIESDANKKISRPSE